MTRRSASAALAILTVFALASCSSGSSGTSDGDASTDAAVPTDTQTTDEAATSDTPSATPSPASMLTSVGTISYESGGGYTWTVEPKFGKVVPVTDSSVDQALVQACNADPQTAGYIPMQIVTTSTASDFAEDTASSFTLGHTSEIATSGGTGDLVDGVSWAAELGDGPNCQEASPSEAAKWTITHAQMAPGAVTTTRGGIVINNWKSPNNPDGDPYYDDLWICTSYISSQSDGGVRWTVSDASGTNMQVDDTQGRIGGASGPTRYAFPASGS